MDARREDTLSVVHFQEWIIAHIDSLHALAKKLGVEEEEITLVTGFHRTKSWSSVTVNSEKSDVEFSLGFDAPIIGASASWHSSNHRIQGAVRNQGPSGDKVCDTQIATCKGRRILNSDAFP